MSACVSGPAWRLASWEAGEAGGLQAHKKKWLVLLPDESAPGWAGEKKGAASAGTFLPKIVFSLQVGRQEIWVCLTCR